MFLSVQQQTCLHNTNLDYVINDNNSSNNNDNNNNNKKKKAIIK